MRNLLRPKAVLPVAAALGLLIVLGSALAARRAGLKLIELDPSYNHDRFVTKPVDIVRHFRAYTTSFDGDDDNDGDGAADRWAIPEWVAYELRATPANLGRAPRRPRSWITDEDLHTQKVAPNDASYRHSNYSREHMCMKSHAWRLGANADWNTHTVLNACPQKQTMNNGAWRALEELTGKWADTYGVVWIICGPIIFNNTPSLWIGDQGEVPIAVLDAFFKIVVAESDTIGAPDVLAFIFPMKGDEHYGSRSPDRLLKPFLTSVDIIETLTGLDFLTDLDDETEQLTEEIVHTDFWAYQAAPPAVP